jgi:hypothetical protein
MLSRVALAKIDVLEELSTCIIRVTRIGEVGTMLAVTSNRCTQCACKLLATCIISAHQHAKPYKLVSDYPDTTRLPNRSIVFTCDAPVLEMFYCMS